MQPLRRLEAPQKLADLPCAQQPHLWVFIHRKHKHSFKIAHTPVVTAALFTARRGRDLSAPDGRLDEGAVHAFNQVPEKREPCHATTRMARD